MRDGLAGVGVGAFVVACCAAVPLVAGVLGGLALAPVIGVGALAVAVAFVGPLVFRRRRGACATEPSGDR